MARRHRDVHRVVEQVHELDVPRPLAARHHQAAVLSEIGAVGIVDGEPPVLRAVWASGPDSFLALQVPVDRQLFERLEKETGIEVRPEVETRDRHRDDEEKKDERAEAEKPAAEPPPKVAAKAQGEARAEMPPSEPAEQKDKA